MAAVFMILGIVAGTFTAGLALAAGAGLAAAFLAYVGGGILGLAGGLVLTMRSGESLMTALPRPE